MVKDHSFKIIDILSHIYFNVIFKKCGRILKNIA